MNESGPWEAQANESSGTTAFGARPIALRADSDDATGGAMGARLAGAGLPQAHGFDLASATYDVLSPSGVPDSGAFAGQHEWFVDRLFFGQHGREQVQDFPGFSARQQHPG